MLRSSHQGGPDLIASCISSIARSAWRRSPTPDLSPRRAGGFPPAASCLPPRPPTSRRAAPPREVGAGDERSRNPPATAEMPRTLFVCFGYQVSVQLPAGSLVQPINRLTCIIKWPYSPFDPRYLVFLAFLQYEGAFFVDNGHVNLEY